MSNQTGRSIRAQLMWLSLIIVTVSVALSLAGTLYITLRTERKTLDQNLLNSASILSQVPLVREALLGEVPADELADFLDAATARTSDIDLILVGDTESVLRYAPDRSFIGSRYTGSAQTRALAGAEPYTFDDSGPMGSDHSAYAPIRDESGAVIGFMAVGLYLRSLTHVALTTALRLAAIGALAAAVGALLALRLSRRIKRSLMGYEPDAFARRFHQREDILETLEEGIIAIDKNAAVIYVNPAGLRLLNAQQLSDVLGRPLKELYPDTLLPRLLTTGKPEYNVHLQHVPGSKAALSDRMPIWEDDKIVGAVAIFQDRTEATAMAEELTGVRHLVEAMRAYTHEFINKLHIILGMIQLGQVEQAEQYILDISQIHHQSVSRVMSQIEDTAVAALLVGKTSRAAELGINLHLDPRSTLSADGRFLPSGVLVTILGNLIENATESLDHSTWKQKEIAVSIREKPDSLLLCVEDTGPGILPELLPFIFEPNVSTKGDGHGIGLSRIRELVNLYHGQIRVESEPKSGTAFFLSFQTPEEIPGITLESFLRTAAGAVTGKPVKVMKFRREMAAQMEALNMDPSYADRYLNVGFSGGEKKKAEILQLLMLKPALALLDETDSGLDVDAVKTVASGIKAYHNADNALIIITHNAKILEGLQVDYVHVLDDARIVRTGDGSLVNEIIEEGFTALKEDEAK